MQVELKKIGYHYRLMMGNEPIGDIAAVPKYNATYLIGFIIAEEYRDNGLGTWMLKEVLKEHNDVYLHCNNDKVRFYERCGFEQIASGSTYAEMWYIKEYHK